MSEQPVEKPLNYPQILTRIIKGGAGPVPHYDRELMQQYVIFEIVRLLRDIKRWLGVIGILIVLGVGITLLGSLGALLGK